ncbi:hypothetical protein BOTBODRAFT_184712 [Botryobasidium botryosum FD-172 SS1]|uniref:Thioesterase domain-containing protein n=1 Tax=Botryobasidium botryosum (strain FD-172 SS1) TaxID=930990 RepID=A0A067MW16_BOTB1|nr:hypothetical protein BOTBODRAFT_184712 [Botryobasidium botryosum FD-172 SS1]
MAAEIVSQAAAKWWWWLGRKSKPTTSRSLNRLKFQFLATLEPRCLPRSNLIIDMSYLRHKLPTLAALQSRLALRALHHPGRFSSSIRDLQAAFRDPKSPFYLAPGEKGPASPDEASSAAGRTITTNATQPMFDDRPDDRESAINYALEKGYDPASFWEQKICWGDLDSFRHLNNVHYLRFMESSRMKWMEAIAEEVGGSARRERMMAGHGVSLILKSIELKYKRPVTYPDTLLIASKPHKLAPTQFVLESVAYSYAQRAPVNIASAVCVWYNYDILKKCEMPQDMEELLQKKATA